MVIYNAIYIINHTGARVNYVHISTNYNIIMYNYVYLITIMYMYSTYF